MSFIRGLAGIQQELAKRPSSADFEDKVKARYVSLDNGQTVKLVFLQEIDEGSPNYNATNGVTVFVLMHSSPDNWKKSAKCTADLEDCYGCKHGWKQKVLIYANVLVDDGKEAPYVAIWNRGLGKNSVAQSLIDMAADEDFGNAVSDKTFKYTRTGEKKETTYSLSAVPKPHTLNVEDYDLYDLEKYVFTVAPERQEAYYLDNQEAAASGSKREVSATLQDAEW